MIRNIAAAVLIHRSTQLIQLLIPPAKLFADYRSIGLETPRRLNPALLALRTTPAEFAVFLSIFALCTCFRHQRALFWRHRTLFFWRAAEDLDVTSERTHPCVRGRGHPCPHLSGSFAQAGMPANRTQGCRRSFRSVRRRWPPGLSRPTPRRCLRRGGEDKDR